MKKQTVEILNRLYQENRLGYGDYCTIYDGLTEIDTLRDRDEYLEELWAKFGDIPMNPETECIEEPFMGWDAGIHREEIWHWFDARHSKGVAYLLGTGEVDHDKVSKLIKLGDMCDDCESSDCAFNSSGVCRFALVHERGPEITEEDGCLCYHLFSHQQKVFTLQSESEWYDKFETRSEHDSYDEAVEAAGRLFDAGDDGDFLIVEQATGIKLCLPGHTFHKEPCPECGKELRVRDMVRTHDCHGIPFRSVCQDCYDRIMGDRGFDGEEYSEADEYIDSDY